MTWWTGLELLALLSEELQFYLLEDLYRLRHRAFHPDGAVYVSVTALVGAMHSRSGWKASCLLT